MSDAGKGLPKVPRGNNKLLVGGVAAVSAGLGLFWYAQKSYQGHKETTSAAGAIPTWEQRLQQENQPSNSSDQQQLRSASHKDVPAGPKSVPLPDNDNDERSTGARSAYATAARGKASDKNQDTEPTNQRAKDADSGTIASEHPDAGHDHNRAGSGKVDSKRSF
ncbi:hypothetical protein K466DRAFT_604880 [Polyporus arcularius HHB13444]|uniref:Uncharacterized protein n=2 Tax=Polyporaceae TaxID=5317 RepID=A0A5C3NUH5_9APHY|nr:hypothetical protein OH76DRAFT_1562159 [Polyporus brumalis]TFK80985.1 hypothetical protein K466DRAFT_604880 [Polyporus arcularius HHB13444]